MNSKTILRNTAWYGLEQAIGMVASLITSVAIARTLGPTQMGYLIYVTWVANLASSFGSIGIPATTRKYMAEFLGAGDPLTARFVYFRTLWLQAATATLATVACIVWVMMTSPVEYRIASILLVVSIWPAMVNFVSAQANMAAEDMSANLPASVASTAVYFVMVMAAVIFHWGVIGVAAAMLGMRFADFIVRFVPTCRSVRASAPRGGTAPQDIRSRMLHFAVQSMLGMALTLVVWDRSEFFLLKHLSTDIRQIAFYSVSFNFAERLLVFPTVFAAATGASMLAQYGRDRTRVPALTAAAARYLGLTSIPLHFIAAALGAAVLLTLYGHQYVDAVAVFMVAPLLCLPKAFLTPIQTLFEAVEKQKYFIWTTIVASVLDIGVAWWLIPRIGALGAALGSGAAQTLAITTLWVLGVRKYEIRLPWAFLMKTVASSAVAGGLAFLVTLHTRPQVGLAAGGCVAVVAFFTMASLLRMFEREDLARFKVIVDACPAALAAPVNLTYSWLSRGVQPAITEELP